MTNTVLLNNIDHQDLKIVPHYGAAFGDAVNQTVVFPTEFAEVQKEYPILFRKDEDGKYQSVALLGFDKGENLFLDGQEWHAHHVPVFHQRGPFMIGFQNQEVDGDVRREPVIYVDLDDPRVGQEEGFPLFLAQGGSAPFLQRISQVLRAISVGLEMEDRMFAAFEAANLIEPASLDVQLDRHTAIQIPGVCSISEEKLYGLAGEGLERLHQSGFLRLAYLAQASLSNVSRLVEIRNARRMAAE